MKCSADMAPEGNFSIALHRPLETSPWRPLMVTVGPITKGLEDVFELAKQLLIYDESLIGFSIWRDREMVAFLPRGSELTELLLRSRRDSWMRVCRMEAEMQSVQRRN